MTSTKTIRYSSHGRPPTGGADRRGFTLVELLVADGDHRDPLELHPRRRDGRRPPRRGARDPDPDHQARGGLNDRLEPCSRPGPITTPPICSWRRSTTAPTRPPPSTIRTPSPACSGPRSSPGTTISRASCPTSSSSRTHDRLPTTRSTSRRTRIPGRHHGGHRPTTILPLGNSIILPARATRSTTATRPNSLYPNPDRDRDLRRVVPGRGRDLQEPRLPADRATTASTTTATA